MVSESALFYYSIFLSFVYVHSGRYCQTNQFYWTAIDHNNSYNIFCCIVRDGAVVRALASHQSGLGSTPGPGVICRLSLLLVLALAPRSFLQVLRFFPLLRNQWPFLYYRTLYPSGRNWASICCSSGYASLV